MGLGNQNTFRKETMNFRRKRSNTNTNLANQKNVIKDGISINIEKDDRDSLIEILVGIKQSMSDLRQNQLQNHEDTKLLKKAISIYVENNGVKPEIKKIVKNLLQD